MSIVHDAVIVGAGWSGLAAAIELTQAGLKVLVIEAAPQVGGRARGAPIRLGGHLLPLDNGQHLLIGGYHQCLELAQRVRSLDIAGDPADHGHPGPESYLHRRPLSLRAVDGLTLQAKRLPAPWHLLLALIDANGLNLRQRLMIIRLMLQLRLSGWRARPQETVRAMLERLGQSDELCSRLWDPLVLAAMNTESAQACAHTFANVLRDSLGARAADSDFLLPHGSLSDLFSEPAGRWLETNGASLRLRSPVRELKPHDQHWIAQLGDEPIAAKRVVLALPAPQAASLLASTGCEEPSLLRLCESLRLFEYDSIATAYLAWPREAVKQLPAWIMLTEQPDGPGQWLFDRGEHADLRIAAVVVSASSRNAHLTHQQLGAQIAAQISRQLGLPYPADVRVLNDKRATIRCTPDRPRIDSQIKLLDLFADQSGCTGSYAQTSAAAESNHKAPGKAWDNIRLAGDYAYPDYPSTLESAVRSGRLAARSLL